jgi:hypothetical protein
MTRRALDETGTTSSPAILTATMSNTSTTDPTRLAAAAAAAAVPPLWKHARHAPSRRTRATLSNLRLLATIVRIRGGLRAARSTARRAARPTTGDQRRGRRRQLSRPAQGRRRRTFETGTFQDRRPRQMRSTECSLPFRGSPHFQNNYLEQFTLSISNNNKRPTKTTPGPIETTEINRSDRDQERDKTRSPDPKERDQPAMRPLANRATPPTLQCSQP